MLSFSGASWSISLATYKKKKRRMGHNCFQSRDWNNPIRINIWNNGPSRRFHFCKKNDSSIEIYCHLLKIIFIQVSFENQWWEKMAMIDDERQIVISLRSTTLQMWRTLLIRTLKRIVIQDNLELRSFESGSSTWREFSLKKSLDASCYVAILRYTPE